MTDYNEYYRLRNVDVTTYAKYNIPTYLKKVLPASKDTAILDIGCGLGHLLRELNREGYSNASGIDVSESSVEICNLQGLHVAKISDLLEFCEQSSSRYGFVILSHVLEHLEKETIINVLKAIRRCLLASDGMVMVMVPNAQSHTGCYWAYEDFSHQTLFTAGSLYFVLKAAGFHEVRFLDPEGLEGSKPLFKYPKKILLHLYKSNLRFWNLVTGSSFHRPSPQIFTYELKALAK